MIKARPWCFKYALAVDRIEANFKDAGAAPLGGNEVSGFMKQKQAHIANHSHQGHDRFASRIEQHDARNDENTPMDIDVNAFDAQQACEGGGPSLFGDFNQSGHGNLASIISRNFHKSDITTGNEDVNWPRRMIR